MSRYFLSEPIFSAAVDTIDRENGIIRGITVAKTGPARGHDGQLDKTFLLQVVELAASRPQGIKARFGHPNMCTTALGTYLGRFHDYAYHADRVTATLRLDQTSKATPSGNLFDYVLDMAENNPDMFGASLVFEAAEFETAENMESGKKTTIKYFRLKELRATDIVDDPSATDGLFSAETIPGQATQFLDENPELSEFIFSKPENIIEFLNNYLNNSNMNLSESIKNNFRRIFSLDNQATIPDVHTQELVIESEVPERPALRCPELAEGSEVEMSRRAEVPVTDPQELGSEARWLSEAEASRRAVHTEQSRSEVEARWLSEVEAITKAFESFTTLFPNLTGIEKSPEGNFIFQDGEQSAALTSDDMLNTMLQTLESLNESLSQADALIQNLNNKLAARPTLPNQVTDPQVTVHLSDPEQDETGKQILRSIPPDLRHKLRKPKPTNA